MMTWIGRITKILVIVIVLLCTVISANATIYVPYSSVTENTSQVRDLIDIMRNDTEYDPYNEYVVMRISQDQYVICFGSKISEGATTYTYTLGQMGAPSSIVRGHVNTVQINDNGYTYVGNIEGSLSSTREQGYKFQYVIMIIGIVIVVLHGFKLFRKTEGAKVTYYGMR